MGGKAYFSHGTAGSRDVALLFRRDFTPSIVKTSLDQDGGFIMLDISHQTHVFTVGCIYAQTQDRPNEQANFLDALMHRGCIGRHEWRECDNRQ